MLLEDLTAKTATTATALNRKALFIDTGSSAETTP
jgi:hypothetical protein